MCKLRLAPALLGYGLGIFLLSGCSSRDVVEGSIIRGGDQVKVEVEITSVENIEVDEVIGRLENDRTMAQFRIQNDADEPQRLKINWEWRDADGFKLRAGRGERASEFLVLRAGEDRTQTYTSPTEKAVRFYARVKNTGRREE